MAARAALLKTLQEVRRWLELRYDVVLTGDHGSGRSTLTRALHRAAVDNDWHVFAVSGHRWARQRFAALTAHPLVADSSRAGPWTATDLAAIVDGELRGPTSNLLLVDDAHLLDPDSIATLGRVLQRPDVRLCVSTSRAAAREAGAHTDLVRAGRATGVAMPPLGYLELSALLAEHLGAPADTGLVSAVVAQSAGNPAAALAFADAARFIQAIDDSGGVWHQVAPFDRLPLEGVVHALTVDLPAEARKALDLLALAGPMRLPHAQQLVGPEVLELLAAEDRLGTNPLQDPDVLAVSPPALSDALLDRLGDLDRMSLTRRIQKAFGAEQPAPAQVPQVLDLVLVENAGLKDQELRTVARVTALVHERAAAQDAVRFAAWRAAPTVEHAVDYLDGLMNPTNPDHVRDVLTGTERTEADPPPVVAQFAIQRALWHLRAERTQSKAGPATSGPPLDLGTDAIAWADVVLRRAIAYLREYPDLAHAARDDLAEWFRAWNLVTRCGVLLEEGQCQQALVLLDEAEDQVGLPRTVSRHMEGMRGDALMLMGDVPRAEQWAREQLQHAYSRLDPLGVRLHSMKLAEVLRMTAHNREAWQVVATSLRMGPPSPFEAGYYERTLALGAVLRADAGDLTGARALARELDAHPTTLRPVLGGARTWAHAMLAYAEGADEVAEQLLLSGAREQANHGAGASALLCWTGRQSPWPLEQADEMAATAERFGVPLFLPLVDLHASLAEGSPSRVRRALRGVGYGVSTPVVALALAYSTESDQDASSDFAQGLHPVVARRVEQLRTDAERTEASEPLTDRERQIALMARAGRSNREIAEQLFLSARTVEYHLYRAMRKLGARTREDLVRWVPDDTW